MSNRQNCPPHTGNQGYDRTWTKAGSNLAWVFIGVLFVRVLWETVRTGIKCSAADNLDRGRMTNQPAHDAAWRESSKYLACVFIGVLLFGVPWYLADEVVHTLDLTLYLYHLLSFLFYVLAGVCVVFGGWAFLHRQAKRVLKEEEGDLRIHEVLPLLPTSGREGWHNVFGAVTYVTIALAFHLVATYTLKLPDPWVGICKGLALIFGALAAVHTAHAVAYFASRHLLNRSPDFLQKDRGPGRKRIRQVGAAIGSILAALAALATIVDVFGSTP